MLLGTGSRRSIDEAMWKYSADYEYEHEDLVQLQRKKCQPNPPMPRKNNKKKKGRNNNPRGKLEALFEQEREFSSRTPIVVLHPDSASPRRHKIALSGAYSERHTTNTCGRQDCKFEADVLRAECNLLRRENDLLIKRCHSLLINSKESKRKGWKATTLEGQVEELHMKLERLRTNSEFRESQLHLHLLLGKCSTNFDPQLNHLNSPFDYSTSPHQQYTSSPSSINSTNSPTFRYQDEDFPTSASASKRSYSVQASQEESLRRKFRSLLSEEIAETDRGSNRSWNRLTRMAGYANVRGDGVCSDRCQETVRRIAQEVQGETEQWRQIQEILHRVHREMENLQKSRDFWKEQATKSRNTTIKLKDTVYKWKERARVSGMKHHQVQQLQLQSEIPESRYKVNRHTEEEEEGESRDVSSYCASESPESCRRERESDVQTKHMTMQLYEEKRSRGTQTRGARKFKGLVDITNHDKSSNIVMRSIRSPAPRMYTQKNRPPVYHPR